MARRQLLRDLIHGPHLRRRSARFRLTTLYCALFFPSGVVLVVITYVLIVLVQRPVDNAVLSQVTHRARTASHGGPITAMTGPVGAGANHVINVATVTLPGHIVLVGRELVVGSCVILFAMIGMSVMLGWLVAGRVLRPLQLMTTATRHISERNLHERLALAGPNDELRVLGDTIDELLARLESAFSSQQRFVANASHELRTPLMLSQTLLQVALANPELTLDSLRAACEQAIDAGRDQAQLIDALLTLARSQRGLDERESVDLRAVTSDAVGAHRASAAASGLQIDATLGDAEVSGDARLVYRMVSNLLDNAIRYNVPGGRVEVTLVASTAEITLTVTNTGLVVEEDQIGRLLEPFQRADPERTAGPSGLGLGLGLGLSIVAEIAVAHGADLEVLPRPEGGLTVAVSFTPDAVATDARTRNDPQ